jgi:hypothetical protein
MESGRRYTSFGRREKGDTCVKYVGVGRIAWSNVWADEHGTRSREGKKIQSWKEVGKKGGRNRGQVSLV